MCVLCDAANKIEMFLVIKSNFKCCVSLSAHKFRVSQEKTFQLRIVGVRHKHNCFTNITAR